VAPQAPDVLAVRGGARAALELTGTISNLGIDHFICGDQPAGRSS
jgi:hypothetical protein